MPNKTKKQTNVGPILTEYIVIAHQDQPCNAHVTLQTMWYHNEPFKHPDQRYE